MKNLLNELKEKIEDMEKHKEPMNSADWNERIGFLLSGDEIKTILDYVKANPLDGTVMPKIADLVEMPEHIKIFNASTERCDMLQGPCACGAYHKLTDWKIKSNFSV